MGRKKSSHGMGWDYPIPHGALIRKILFAEDDLDKETLIDGYYEE
jgi:hypothetical protein